MKTDVLIIGSGIFGSVISSKLRQLGMNFEIVDRHCMNAGSQPAACLMKPSWFSSMGKELYIPAMDTLQNLYNVREIEFQTKVLKTKVSWINPREIMNQPHQIDKVENIIVSDGGYVTFLQCSEAIESRNVIIAAGIWSNQILKESGYQLVPDLQPKTGTAFKVIGQTSVPRIHSWMMYKQIVSFNIDEENIWIGDGVANKNYTNDTLQKSRERCAGFLGKGTGELSPTTGHRPYVTDAKPCYLKEHAPGLWVVTGGAKNGTIAAGWAAHKLGEILC